MTESEIIQFAKESLPGLDVVVASEATGAPEESWGDTFLFYNPAGESPDRRLPFATIVTQDYDGFDTVSDLSRPGVFRVNMWIGRDRLQSLLGGREANVYDFTALNTLLPHPVYAPQGWVSILNPGPEATELTKSLLTEAHARAINRRQSQSSR